MISENALKIMMFRLNRSFWPSENFPWLQIGLLDFLKTFKGSNDVSIKNYSSIFFKVKFFIFLKMFAIFVYFFWFIDLQLIFRSISIIRVTDRSLDRFDQQVAELFVNITLVHKILYL